MLRQILGHTLHYSLYIQLGGEISFCLNALSHLTLAEISHQMEIHSANILAMLAHGLWVTLVKQKLSFSVCCMDFFSMEMPDGVQHDKQ